MARTGRTRVIGPTFMPDLGRGQFARSGTRGHLRFVSTDTSIGAYSLVPGARSKVLNRGAIVRVSDTDVTYLTTPLNPREKISSDSGESPTKRDVKHGPELPHSPNPAASGRITVSAVVEKASPASREAVDSVMLNRHTAPEPKKWPFFWTHRTRMTDWLLRDTGPVCYEVSGRSLSAYNDLVEVVERLSQRGGTYSDLGEQFIHEHQARKGHAGAQRLLSRHEMVVGTMAAMHFHLAFCPVTFAMLSGCVYFLPDEVVIADNAGQCVFVPYHELRCHVSEGVHMGVPVPAWSQPVGYTWKYMNKDGGPDRRYNDNYQIPHYKVWEVDFTFPGGRVDTAFADGELANRLVDCVNTLARLGAGRR